MSSPRPTGVNLILLAVTILSLMLAAYSLLVSPVAPGRVPASNGFQEPEQARESSSRQGPGSNIDHDGTAPTGGERPHRSDPSPACGPSDAPKDTTTSDPEHKEPPGSTDPQAPPQTGTITGQVLDAKGQPVENARVVASRADTAFQGGYDLDELGLRFEEIEREIARLRASQREATSGADGQFTLTGLNQSQAYNLTATAASGGSATLKRVACGDNVVVLLSRDCLLRGRVQTDSGAALTSFRLCWIRADLPNEPQGKRFRSDDGSYEVRVTPGRHSVWVELAGFVPGARQEVDVPDGGLELNFKMEGLASLSGVVTDLQTNPLQGVNVLLKCLDEGSTDEVEEARKQMEGFNPTVTAVSDSLGRYRFEAVAPGRYSATVSIASRADSREIALVAGANKQDFSLSAGARVTLKFRGQGTEPVSDVSVAFERKGRSVRPVALPAAEPGVRVFIGLEPGDYSIRYFARGGAWARLEAKLGDGDNQLTLDIAPAAFLQGKVSGGGAPVGLVLRLRPESGKADNNSHYSATVGSDGSYRAGPALAGDFVLELLAQGRNVVHTQTVKLGAGEQNLDIAVRDVASLLVRVVLPDGKPATNAKVALTVGKAKFSARCDSKGEARFGYVATGPARLLSDSGTLRSSVHDFTLVAGESELALALKAPNCVLVTSVNKGSEAERAGLQVNDLIISYNGLDATGANSLNALIKAAQNTESLSIVIDRGGRLSTLNAKGGALGAAFQDAVR